MTQYQLTLERETMQRLFGNSEQLRQLLESVVNQVLEAQVSEHVQAEPYERTEERRGYRNGYKPRQLTTRVGTLVLRIPQVRDGSFSPELFERYQRSEQALVCTLMEMVVNGVSTRKVLRITDELCGKDFSKSTVSALCQQLDPVVHAWYSVDAGTEKSLSTVRLNGRAARSGVRTVVGPVFMRVAPVGRRTLAPLIFFHQHPAPLQTFCRPSFRGSVVLRLRRHIGRQDHPGLLGRRVNMDAGR